LGYYLPVRIFKNTWFDRFAVKEGIMDSELTELVNQLEAGHAEAELGSGVYKIRVARPGKGKSGGYRVIVFFRSEARTFFVYGFSKSALGNINKRQLRDFKKAAKISLAYTDAQLDELIKGKWFIEI
jgi:hypothetical protein